MLSTFTSTELLLAHIVFDTFTMLFLFLNRTCVTNRIFRTLQLMLSFSITLAQPFACLYVHSTICLCIFFLFNFGALNMCQKCLPISSGCCPRFSTGVVSPKETIASSSSRWCALIVGVAYYNYFLIPHCTSHPLMSLTSHHNSTTSLASPSSTSESLTLFVATIGDKIFDIDNVNGC